MGRNKLQLNLFINNLELGVGSEITKIEVNTKTFKNVKTKVNAK